MEIPKGPANFRGKIEASQKFWEESKIDQKKVKKSDRTRHDFFLGIVKGLLKTIETPPGPLQMSVFGPEFFVLPPERQISLPKMGSPSIQNVRGPPRSIIFRRVKVFLSQVRKKYLQKSGSLQKKHKNKNLVVRK